MKEYLNLYEAIWANAVLDDVRSATDKLYHHAFGSAYDLYVTKADMPLEPNDDKLKRFRQDTRNYCKMKVRKKLEKRIKELLYQEGQAWPKNKNYKIVDKEYNRILKDLKDEVKIFAEERMKRNWRNYRDAN